MDVEGQFTLDLNDSEINLLAVQNKSALEIHCKFLPFSGEYILQLL